MVEIRVFITPVVNGTYIMDCGFEVNATGHLYYRSEDEAKVFEWFGKKMHTQKWTLTCGGPANPYAPELDSQGRFYDYVYSMKRHTDDRTKEGVSGDYTKEDIMLE